MGRQILTAAVTVVAAFFLGSGSLAYAYGGGKGGKSSASTLDHEVRHSSPSSRATPPSVVRSKGRTRHKATVDGSILNSPSESKPSHKYGTRSKNKPDSGTASSSTSRGLNHVRNVSVRLSKKDYQAALENLPDNPSQEQIKAELLSLYREKFVRAVWKGIVKGDEPDGGITIHVTAASAKDFKLDIHSTELVSEVSRVSLTSPTGSAQATSSLGSEPEVVTSSPRADKLGRAKVVVDMAELTKLREFTGFQFVSWIPGLSQLAGRLLHKDPLMKSTFVLGKEKQNLEYVVYRQPKQEEYVARLAQVTDGQGETHNGFTRFQPVYSDQKLIGITIALMATPKSLGGTPTITTAHEKLRVKLSWPKSFEQTAENVLVNIEVAPAHPHWRSASGAAIAPVKSTLSMNGDLSSAIGEFNRAAGNVSAEKANPTVRLESTSTHVFVPGSSLAPGLYPMLDFSGFGTLLEGYMKASSSDAVLGYLQGLNVQGRFHLPSNDLIAEDQNQPLLHWLVNSHGVNTLYRRDGVSDRQDTITIH